VRSSLALKRESDCRHAKDRGLIRLACHLAKANQEIKLLFHYDGLTGGGRGGVELPELLQVRVR
jgi:hypothetical protein